ncbi:MAG: SOUL family heme-binding protein [Planctomycetota bacterium]|jgi:effector-binding domain-containing protein
METLTKKYIIMIKRRRILHLLIFFSPICLSSCVSVGIEKAKYRVAIKEGKFEIREYSSQIVAETVVDADFDDAGNVAFRRLFDYISGNNRKKESISMTAPVNQKARSEKISMTAPVNQYQSKGRFIVSFVMPSKYTMGSLPEPLDSNIVLRQVPSCKLAAIRYSGSWSKKRYETQKELLEEFIRNKELKITGDAIFARYDPPFQLSFLRRNEVLIPVE